MPVSVSTKSVTFTNGTANDAGPVDSEFTNTFNSLANIKTKVDNLLNGDIEDGKSVTIRKSFSGSPSSTDHLSIIGERGSSTNVTLQWNETKDYWEVTNDGSIYHPISLVASADPASPAEGDVWYNSTTKRLKYRTNTASVLVPLNEPISDVKYRFSNTTLVGTDNGNFIALVNTFTQLLTPAATLGKSWYVHLYNRGTGYVTLDPDGSETVNQLATYKIPPGVSGTLICDSANFFFLTGNQHIIHVRDVQSAGTQGGTTTGGSWQTRTLNTLRMDETGLASVSSNQITLPLGLYEVEATAPATACDGHQLRLYNVTDSVVAVDTAGNDLIGPGANSPSTTQTRATLFGKFYISASKTFELQHKTKSNRSTDGLGTAMNMGEPEVYADIIFRRVG